MKYQFFTIPAKYPEESQQLLNAFCAGHRVLTLEKQFVDSGNESFWSICVSYMDANTLAVAGAGSNRRAQIDYRSGVFQINDMGL